MTHHQDFPTTRNPTPSDGEIRAAVGILLKCGLSIEVITRDSSLSLENVLAIVDSLIVDSSTKATT